MLEVQVEDVIRALAGDSQNDPAFAAAIAAANESLRQGASKDYIDEFAEAFRKQAGGVSLASIFVSPDRKDITLETSDAEVVRILKRETEAAIAASFNVLRSRIDHFGVTQPNIMRLPNSHRILVELPGVKEPQRVRDLLQGTASLEFWTTYDAREILPRLMDVDKFLRSEAEAAATTEAAEETVTADRGGRERRSGRGDRRHALRPREESLLRTARSRLCGRSRGRCRLQVGHGRDRRLPGAARRARPAARRPHVQVGREGRRQQRRPLLPLRHPRADARRQGAAGRQRGDRRRRDLRAARCRGRGFDDHERRGRPGVGASDGRERGQVHRHRARRLCLLGAPRQYEDRQGYLLHHGRFHHPGGQGPRQRAQVG